jgi:hypothetical protein
MHIKCSFKFEKVELHLNMQQDNDKVAQHIQFITTSNVSNKLNQKIYIRISNAYRIKL